MRIISFVLLLLGVCISEADAQKITINEDYEVEQLMDQYVRINTAKSYVEGWRVQVISTTDRQKLESVRQSLKSRYPYLSTSWVHNRPYYRLRAGAFATKLEALQLQHLLREYYPGSIPTRDTEVSASEIIGL
ncbi:MAG: hypothetical protein Sapg2KO_22100 [Saprospiraceae bacterium]